MRHHLAVIYRPFLRLIRDRKKTVECRLGQAGVPPHGAMESGDLIWFKEANGPIRLVAVVRSVRFFCPLTPHEVDLIHKQYGQYILAPWSFWRAHRYANAATLAWLGEISELEPFQISKYDRRAWTVLGGPPVPIPKVEDVGSFVVDHDEVRRRIQEG